MVVRIYFPLIKMVYANYTAMEAPGKYHPAGPGESLGQSEHSNTPEWKGGWRMDLNWEEHELQHFPVKRKDH